MNKPAISAQHLTYLELFKLVEADGSSDAHKYQMTMTALKGVIAFNTVLHSQLKEFHGDTYRLALAQNQRFVRSLVGQLVSTRAQNLPFMYYVKRVEGMAIKTYFRLYMLETTPECKIVFDDTRHCRALDKLVYGELFFNLDLY
jgi:hypothetical protein